MLGLALRSLGCGPGLYDAKSSGTTKGDLIMISLRVIAATLLVLAALAGSASAQPGQGPVATACVDDIAQFCAGKEHGQGEVRACLDANKDKVTAACKTALETTGGGR
jgi:hypothetical protein